MRTLLAIVPVILLIVSGCASLSAPERDIQVIASTSSARDASAAAQRLRVAGVSAFPALVARLDDGTTVPSDAFDTRDILMHHADGSWSAYRASVGAVCFEIIQSQVQGDGWPKGFRSYYAFTGSDVADWLASHSGASLEQLRKAAWAESLGRIDRDLAGSPDSEHLQSIRNFLQRQELSPPN